MSNRSSSTPTPSPAHPAVAVPPFNDVTKHNLVALQLAIRHLIDKACFISFDTEFTGLGGKGAGLRAPDMQERYKNLRNLVRNHALVAFGLTIFEKSDTVTGTSTPSPNTEELTSSTSSAARKSEKPVSAINYVVHNFNFTMLCQNEFVVTPSSMSFLVENGFDFNRQYRDGIPYFPGNDQDPLQKAQQQQQPPQPPSFASKTNQIMRSLFSHIVARGAPVVVHNGLLDLLFLYQSFYAELPDDIQVFLADLSEMFPGGIYDTKYLAEFVDREKASEREHLDRQFYGKQNYLVCTIRDQMKSVAPPPQVNDDEQEAEKDGSDGGKPYCLQYAAHGYCRRGRHCTKTHDLDVILDDELGESEGKRARKRRKQQHKKDTTESVDGPVNDQDEAVNTSAETSTEEGKTADISAADSPATAADDVVMSDGAQQQPNVSAKPSNSEHAIGMGTSSLTPSLATLPTSASPTLSSAGTHPEPLPSNSTSTTTLSTGTDNKTALFETYHSACFDAYMTGFVFARQALEHPFVLQSPSFSSTASSQNDGHPRNNLYLMNKPYPLRVLKSEYAKTSAGHREKQFKLTMGTTANTATTNAISWGSVANGEGGHGVQEAGWEKQQPQRNQQKKRGRGRGGGAPRSSAFFHKRK
ncbi:Target of EGR1, member 1 (Nuclear) [Quaeritorhiza haematococci]|nr:Target of EGR1, member 1 (Nuclear) [Quaeritorhiza haematococci]